MAHLGSRVRFSHDSSGSQHGFPSERCRNSVYKKPPKMCHRAIRPSVGRVVDAKIALFGSGDQYCSSFAFGKGYVFLRFVTLPSQCRCPDPGYCDHGSGRRNMSHASRAAVHRQEQPRLGDGPGAGLLPHMLGSPPMSTWLHEASHREWLGLLAARLPPLPMRCAARNPTFQSRGSVFISYCIVEASKWPKNACMRGRLSERAPW